MKKFIEDIYKNLYGINLQNSTISIFYDIFYQYAISVGLGLLLVGSDNS